MIAWQTGGVHVWVERSDTHRASPETTGYGYPPKEVVLSTRSRGCLSIFGDGYRCAPPILRGLIPLWKLRRSIVRWVLLRLIQPIRRLLWEKGWGGEE